MLAASDRGSFFEQEELIALDEEKQNRWEDETVSASRAKIEGKGKDESAEPDSQESWQKLAGRTIVAGDRLQENLLKSVSCRFCHADVTLLENVSSRSGLGSCWIVSCGNEDCPSRSTNAAFNTTPRGKGFEINRASVLGFRAIGRGHAGASKTLSFLGLKPIDKHYWSENAKKIEAEAKNLLENELNRAAFEVKERTFALDLLDCTREQLGEVVVDCGVTIDASWCSRGWSATDAVIAAISVDTGKVVDVVHMSSSCTECKKMDQRKMEGEVSRLEYLSWFTKHEPSCYLNHEGSSAVSKFEFLIPYSNLQSGPRMQLLASCLSFFKLFACFCTYHWSSPGGGGGGTLYRILSKFLIPPFLTGTQSKQR